MVTGVAFSPDGKRIARPKREKDVKANRVTFSPDSEFLLAECMGGATVWRSESWDLHFDLPCKGFWLSGVSLSSYGETFAVSGDYAERSRLGLTPVDVRDLGRTPIWPAMSRLAHALCPDFFPGSFDSPL
jgi:WD40 repeat protein